MHIIYIHIIIFLKKEVAFKIKEIHGSWTEVAKGPDVVHVVVIVNTC